MTKPVFKFGDAIAAPYVYPDPARRNEFTHDIRPAVVVGFSHPHQAKRDWGYRGDILVRFADGRKSWVAYPDA